MLSQVVKSWSQRTNRTERLWLLAKIEFKLRYYENKLGLFWALIKPVMDICVYYVVFQVIMQQDIPAFASYMFIGLIFWNFFIESTSGTISILRTKRYLYEYSNMDKLEIYFSTILSNVIGFGFNFLMFLLFYNVIETVSVGPSLMNLWIIPLFLNVFILSLAGSLILSNLYVIAKDISQVWQVFSTFLFFLSPIFYKLSLFKSALPTFEYLNPIAGIIINARRVMMEGKEPNFEVMLFDYGYALLLLLFGLILLNKLGSKAAERL